MMREIEEKGKAAEDELKQKQQEPPSEEETPSISEIETQYMDRRQPHELKAAMAAEELDREIMMKYQSKEAMKKKTWLLKKKVKETIDRPIPPMIVLSEEFGKVDAATAAQGKKIDHNLQAQLDDQMEAFDDPLLTTDSDEPDDKMKVLKKLDPKLVDDEEMYIPKKRIAFS